MADTLGTSVAQRDAALFVARAAELARIERALAPGSTTPIVVLHGPGGVGKSTLVREVMRRATERGCAALRLDGRDLATSADLLDRDWSAVTDDPPWLLVLDSYEHMAALGTHLRRHALPALPASARVILSGRHAPEGRWRDHGWTSSLCSVPLEPLDDDEARLLLDRRGVQDPAVVDAILRWAQGLPLALAVAADAAATIEGFDLADQAVDAGLADALLQQLIATEVDTADRDVLAVAGLAPLVDARLLAAVLPHVDGDRAESWLRGLSMSEARGARLSLHDRVREALRAELRSRDAARDRNLRQRLADHLYDRIALGEPWVLPELASLIEDPAFTWGLTSDPDAFRPDGVRAGDLDAVLASLGGDGPWTAGLARWFHEAPDHIAVVREGDVPRLVALIARPSWLPDFAHEDPVLAHWLDRLREAPLDGELAFVPYVFDLDVPEEQRASAYTVGNVSIHQRLRHRNLRHVWGTVAPHLTSLVAFNTAMGYRPEPALDVVADGRPLCAFTVDYGPAGVAGTIRDLVYADLGLAPPFATAPGTTGAEAVRNALRSFHDSAALAASPLAHGGSVEQRAESVRHLLRTGVERAFGTAANDHTQRAVLELGYLDPDGGHPQAMRKLHLSRTTYFRRLASAAEQLAQHLAT